MKRLLSIFFTFILALPLMAEDEDARAMNPHQLRIGWGDQHFEHLAFHATPQPKNLLPDTYSAAYTENYRYLQHWFVDYQYRLNSWFSFGGKVDGSGVLWDQVKRNGVGDELSRLNNRSVYNIVLVPAVTFTYLHHPYVSLYSGLGIGLDINGGTEKDAYGHTTVCAPALDLTLIGVSAGYHNWFGAVDIGGLFAMNGGQNIYLCGSRLCSVSVGLTF